MALIGSTNKNAAQTKTEEDKMVNGFFVYGTLKVGCGNDGRVKHLLKGSLEARVAGMEMFDLGHFPGMLKSQAATDFVYGEYQEFTNMKAALKSLDALEGYREGREGNFYERVVVPVELAFGEVVEAYAYLINDESVRDRCERCADGVWFPLKKRMQDLVDAAVLAHNLPPVTL